MIADPGSIGLLANLPGVSSERLTIERNWGLR